MFAAQKKLLALLLGWFCLLQIFAAQTFSAAGGSIPDYSNARIFLLHVAALDSPQLNMRYGLKQVCIDISHPRVSDLSVRLLSPDGTTIELVSGAGNGGANFTGTCFSMQATTTILSGNAPFTGSYYPRQNLGECNNGQAGTGLWRLLVQDVVIDDSGTVNYWSITFDTAAPLPLGTPTGICHKFNAAGCGCPDTTQNTCALLPDIIIGEKWFRDTLRRSEFRDSFTVSNSTANIGWGPMEIIGTNQWYCGDSLVSGSVLCPDGRYSRQLVRQRVYIKNAGGYFDFIDTLVGYMRFHSELGHQHLHVEDWIENTLRIRGPEADVSQWPIVGRGQKVSVSLYDHVGCDNIFKACDYADSTYQRMLLRNGGLGLGYAVGGEQVQGISVGYADIYEHLLPFGQAIYFDSICNGDYILVAQFDPHHRFVDFDPTNNITTSPVTLTRQRAGCCHTRFQVDTIDFTQGIFRFVDRSLAMPSQWLWHFGDGDSSTQQFPVHQFTQGGLHHIRLQTATAQGCSGRDSLLLWLPLNIGVGEFPLRKIIAQLFPNPGNGFFQLQLTTESAQTLRAQLLDIAGRVVQTLATDTLLLMGSNSITFSVETAGLYLLRLQVGRQTIFLKVVNE